MSPDETFLRAFEDCTLPFAEWRHRAHLKVAYLYLRELTFDDALTKARMNIKRYNAATNTPEALERGYHETITVSWMRLVQFALEERGPAASAEEFVEREAQFLNKEALLRFYSREHLISWRAKSEFVEPDIAPFPTSAAQAGNGRIHESPLIHGLAELAPPNRMKRWLLITTEPIEEQALVAQRVMSHGMGAAVYFAGVVRGSEEGAGISAIDYESFGQMAEHQFQLLFDGMEKKWPVESVRLVHRIGLVRVNEPSLWVEVIAPHRGEAFAACQWLIDEMKRVVPIWKRPVRSET